MTCPDCDLDPCCCDLDIPEIREYWIWAIAERDSVFAGQDPESIEARRADALLKLLRRRIAEAGPLWENHWYIEYAQYRPNWWPKDKREREGRE